MIFHIITGFSDVGGAESALIRIINSTNVDRIVLVSLMSTNVEMKKKLIYKHVEVIALGANGPVSMLFSIFKLVLLITKYQPQKLYSWMYHANVITALASLLTFKKIPLVWGVRHSLDDFSGEKFSTKLAILIGSLLKSVPQKVIYCSLNSQKQHEVFGYNLPSKSVYIPNGYTFNKLIPRSFDDEPVVIGAAGRFHEAKDYKTLFKMFKHLKSKNLNVELHVCGRDINFDNKHLISIVKDLSLNLCDVSLLGEVKVMSSFYEKIDIFVLSSKTEAFPNVLAEAASHGCAVFSTNVGDASKIVNNSEHIVPVKDHIKLADSITKYLSYEPAVKKKVVMKTTEHVRRNFSINEIAKRFSQV